MTFSPTPDEFRETIYSYYYKNRRSFPWRETQDPYRIMVSELMLQQTQASRVVEKYVAFLEAFPTVESLAAASTAAVLTLWQGLGYNRRALNLQRAAQVVVEQHNGAIPSQLDTLQSLPGIGPYTAGAIAAFAFNRPVVCIETNIRRVYIHFFFPNEEVVHDRELLPIIEETIDVSQPREWYYALMDYGAMLVKQVENPNHRSRHYTKQSAFKGSNRQMRGAIIRFLVKSSKATKHDLGEALNIESDKLEACLGQLTEEGFITEQLPYYQLTS